MTKEKQIADLLNALQAELQSVGLWESQSPSDEQLASQEPFAVDKLAPQQWLQWIFIPRIRMLLTMSQTLPSDFSIAPYFEESWKGSREYSTLIALIHNLDEVFCDA